MLEKSQIKKIRKKIEQEIKETHSKIDQLKIITKPISPENAIGRVSRMDAINNKSVNDAVLRKSEQKLKNLKAALLRVSDHDFGQCMRCKDYIPIARILIMPQSRFCVHCA